MRILVTGGAGFIGKHLCRRLVSEGHDVFAFDCDAFSTLVPGVKYAYGDVRDHFLNWLPEDRPNLDRIYHLACHASPKWYQLDQRETVETCVTGTSHVLKLAIDEGYSGARVLLASTSEVYGEPLEHPQRETTKTHANPLSIRSCYDLGKATAECLMGIYQREHGVDTRIARIFNTYGPLMDFDDGRVISNFVTQALKGEPLTIYGDGSQTRSFCYVDDMVEGLIRLMEYEGSDCHEPHNLGNPEEVPVSGICNMLYQHIVLGRDELHLGQDAYIHRPLPKHKPLPQDDPTRRCPDITRAKQNLGWEPRVGLSEGLKRTVEDFRSRLCATTSP